MKKHYASMLAALTLCLLVAGVAFAKDIAVINGTDFDIRRVYMSDAEDNSWGDDLLGEDVLHPGEGLRITVSGTPNALDLSLYDDEGQEVIFHELDFTDFHTLTVFPDGTGRFE